MRYLILVCVLGLAIACDLGVYIATSADVFESFDPLRPATLLPIVAGRLHALRTRVGDLVNDLVEEFAAPTANASDTSTRLQPRCHSRSGSLGLGTAPHENPFKAPDSHTRVSLAAPSR